MRTQIIELFGGWPTVVVLVQQKLNPNGNAKLTVGQDTRSNRGSYDAWSMALARAQPAIASAADASTIGFDLDLDDEGIFLEAERGERHATARTTGLLRSKDTFLGDDGQVGII